VGKLVELYRLEDHILECNKRYNGVLQKVDAIEKRLTNMEHLLIEIKYAIRGEVYDPD
jgi:hypothetical protein